MSELPTIAAVASAFPSATVDRETAHATLRGLFPDHDERFVTSLLERSGVDLRRVAPPLQELLGNPDFTARNASWHAHALALAERAGRAALERAGLAPERVDTLLDVSCTGIAIPALDAELAPRLGLRSDVRRVPITESGCAAGGLALGLAGPLARGGEHVLVIAVEICSLALSSGERTRTDVVAASLFADGAAAAVVRPAAWPGRNGDGRADRELPRLVGSGSYLVPDSLRTMGFDVGTEGLRIVLQRELPDLLVESAPRAIDAFLARFGKTRADIGLHLLHPGGRRVLEVWEQCFALEPGTLRFSRESLARYGNLSSASILTVIELALEARARVAPGKLALAAAVGPGLALEFSLLEWPSDA